MKPITIILERGLITAVYADNSNTLIVVMDKDLEGCDYQEPQGQTMRASIHTEAVKPYHLMPEDDAETLRTCAVQGVVSPLPQWMTDIANYDGLEVHPVRDLFWNEEEQGTRPFHQPDNIDETCCEVCEPKNAHFWSVYGHSKEGGVIYLEDFPSQDEAQRFAEKLLKTYPHLQEYGLLA